MQYIALLRGINVGGNNKIEMGKLRNLLVSLGYTNVKTYLNSGNVTFESTETPLGINLTNILNKHFGVSIPVLIKTYTEIKSIADAIPSNWVNDNEWKCDVAYLFDEIDSEQTISELPMDKKFCDIRYIKGALFWRVNRNDYNKSRLNKIINHKYYKLMTVRNINTARFLGKWSN